MLCKCSQTLFTRSLGKCWWHLPMWLGIPVKKCKQSTKNAPGHEESLPAWGHGSVTQQEVSRQMALARRPDPSCLFANLQRQTWGPKGESREGCVRYAPVSFVSVPLNSRIPPNLQTASYKTPLTWPPPFAMLPPLPHPICAIINTHPDPNSPGLTCLFLWNQGLPMQVTLATYS